MVFVMIYKAVSICLLSTSLSSVPTIHSLFAVFQPQGPFPVCQILPALVTLAAFALLFAHTWNALHQSQLLVLTSLPADPF